MRSGLGGASDGQYQGGFRSNGKRGAHESGRGLFWGNHEKYTDDKGIAHFESVAPGSHTVYIDGKDKGVQALSGVTTFYI